MTPVRTPQWSPPSQLFFSFFACLVRHIWNSRVVIDKGEQVAELRPLQFSPSVWFGPPFPLFAFDSVFVVKSAFRFLCAVATE